MLEKVSLTIYSRSKSFRPLMIRESRHLLAGLILKKVWIPKIVRNSYQFAKFSESLQISGRHTLGIVEKKLVSYVSKLNFSFKTDILRRFNKIRCSKVYNWNKTMYSFSFLYFLKLIFNCLTKEVVKWCPSLNCFQRETLRLTCTLFISFQMFLP